MVPSFVDLLKTVFEKTISKEEPRLMLILILAFKKRRGKRFSLNWWTAMEILLYRILALSELRPMFREAIKISHQRKRIPFALQHFCRVNDDGCSSKI